MKVLGICASPRINGNTDIILEKTLEGARENGLETEKIILSNLNILPVQEEEYEKVNAEGFSIIDDDMRIIYRKIDEADIFILASPVFFGSLSSQAKIMIDRFQCVWLAKNIFKKEIFRKKKTGAFICVEATMREDFFKNASSIVKHFFATVNIEYKRELFCPGIDKKGKVLEKPKVLQEAYELGRSLARQGAA